MCVPFWLVLAMLLGVICGMSNRPMVRYVALALIFTVCVWGMVYGGHAQA